MAEPASPTVRATAAVLSVLLPLAVLAAPLARWMRADAPAAKSDVAARLERAVAKDPDVVVLGASKVGTDLDLALLARELGLPTEQVAGANLSGTTAPVWYAVLDNRVYGSGQTPKLVVVYSTFDWTLATAPSGETERAVLAGQLDGDDPVLQAKVLGGDGGNVALERLRKHRTEDHTALMGWVRDASVGTLLATPTADEAAAAAGAKLAAPALERLFGLGAGLEVSQVARAIPIVEAERATAAMTATRVEDTLVPDFIDLAAAHGTKIVFVSAPVRRDAEIDVDYAPGTARAVVELLNARGAGYADLRDLRLPDSAFGDATHLNKVGREALTRALVTRIKAMGAMGDGPLAAAKLPVVQAAPVATRTGTPPPLPTLTPKRGGNTCDWEAVVPGLNAISDSELDRAGLGMVSPLQVREDGKPLASNATRDDFAFRCGGASQHQGGVVKFSPTDGPAEVAASRAYALALRDDVPVHNARGHEGWWVYPGTSLTLSFADGWTSDEADPGFGVSVEAIALAAPEGAPMPTLRVDGAGPASHTPVALSGEGMHRAGAVRLTPPKGAWSIAVDAPADGGWILLRRVRIGNAADTRAIVGEDGPTAIAALAAGATYAAAPPELPAKTTFTAHEGAVAKADIATLGVPNTDALWKVGSVAGCSPIRLSEDGALMPNAVVRAQDVVAKGKGAYAQVGDTLFAIGADGTSPAENGRAYTVALEPTRACRGLRWLYPGDTATIKLPPMLLARLLGGIDTLEIGGAAVVAEGTSPEARVVVKVGDEVRLDGTFALATLAQTPPRWSFDPPLPRGPLPITVELSLPSTAPYMLVSSVALSEPGRPAFPTTTAAAEGAR